jgi:hypothetical protein
MASVQAEDARDLELPEDLEQALHLFLRATGAGKESATTSLNTANSTARAPSDLVGRAGHFLAGLGLVSNSVTSTIAYGS